MKYKNHIQHYQNDADFHNYFENNPIEEHNIRRRYSCFFKWLLPLKNGILLEIGSGGGYAMQEIKKTRFDYVALDIPITNLKGIKSRSEKSIYAVSGDAYQLPFKDKNVNTIILSEVLEHFQDPAKALKEMHRILADDGVLLISVPYKETISYQICVHCNKPTPTHAHFHSFDENSLDPFLTDTNLSVDKKQKITNKLLSRISVFFKLNNLPFYLWQLIDRGLNLVIPKPSHIIFRLKKINQYT